MLHRNSPMLSLNPWQKSQRGLAQVLEFSDTTSCSQKSSTFSTQHCLHTKSCNKLPVTMGDLLHCDVHVLMHEFDSLNIHFCWVLIQFRECVLCFGTTTRTPTDPWSLERLYSGTLLQSICRGFHFSLSGFAENVLLLVREANVAVEWRSRSSNSVEVGRHGCTSFWTWQAAFYYSTICTTWNTLPFPGKEL